MKEKEERKKKRWEKTRTRLYEFASVQIQLSKDIREKDLGFFEASIYTRARASIGRNVKYLPLVTPACLN